MITYKAFGSKQEAIEYRETHGTGGWIFAPEAEGETILFPVQFTATMILSHRLTRGLSGELVGCTTPSTKCVGR